MNYLYSLIAICEHLIPDLIEESRFLKNNPNPDRMMVLLNALGPIVDDLAPLIEAEWPEYKDEIEWIDRQYKEWCETEKLP